MKLLWSGPGLDKQQVPMSALHTPKGQSGLRAEYFATKTLSARTHSVVEPGIHIEAPNSDAGQFTFAADDIKLGVELPAGSYTAKWINTKTGQVAKRASLRHPGGTCMLTAPAFKDDIALGITKK